MAYRVLFIDEEKDQQNDFMEYMLKNNPYDEKTNENKYYEWIEMFDFVY